MLEYVRNEAGQGIKANRGNSALDEFCLFIT